MATLQDQRFFPIVATADGAARQAGTWRALSVVVLPLTAQAGRCGPTVSAPHTPAEPRSTSYLVGPVSLGNAPRVGLAGDLAGDPNELVIPMELSKQDS